MGLVNLVGELMTAWRSNIWYGLKTPFFEYVVRWCLDSMVLLGYIESIRIGKELVTYT